VSRNEPYVLDREAYQERMAIMMESGIDPMESSRMATDDAYKTPLALAAKAAVLGDWEPADALCRVERDKHGEAHARELRRSIQDAINEHKKLW
jgi:hypothetical protein